MDISQERAGKYFKENNIKLTDIQKEKIKNIAEKVVDFFKKIIKQVWEMVEKIFNSIDWTKYKKYLKYKRRVNNRKKLYAKCKRKK